MSLSIPTHDNAGERTEAATFQTEPMQNNKFISDWSTCGEDDQPTAEINHLNDDKPNDKTIHFDDDDLNVERSILHDDNLSERLKHLHVSPLDKYSDQLPLCNLHDNQQNQKMNPLHVSPLNKSTHEFPQYPLQNYQVELMIPWQIRQNRFAIIAIDENILAVVSNTVFLKYDLEPDWCRKIIYTLECAGITELYCCGYYVELKRAAGDFMNVYLDSPERHTMRYPCNMCKADNCAVQLAYLYWRKITRRRPCDLEH